MKAIGEFSIVLGCLYGFYLLIGKEPNVEGWWIHIGLGAIAYGIGASFEIRQKHQREQKALKDMQAVVDRHEKSRKERGL